MKTVEHITGRALMCAIASMILIVTVLAVIIILPFIMVGILTEGE